MSTQKEEVYVVVPEVSYKEIRELINFCSDNSINTREVYENVLKNESDFYVDDFRFILSDDIDSIQQEELKNDSYMLGCFNAWFLSDILDAPLEAIELMQKDEAYEGIGVWIIESGKIEELQEQYSCVDGYGHHFNHYDGNEEEMLDYYVFRTN